MSGHAYDDHGKWDIRSVEDLRSLLARAKAPYYVYVLCRPRRGGDLIPFYVGIGQGDRLFAHEAQAKDPSVTGRKVEIIRSIWDAAAEVARFIDSFHTEYPWGHEEALINRFGLLRDGTGVLANHDRYARSVTAEGVELRKYATEGNTLPSNFHHRHTRLKVGPRLPRNPRSVYGKICGVLSTHPGVTGEKLVELLLSVDFSDNPSAYTQSGRVSLPWLAKYIDGGFYEKNQCIQAWEPSDNIAQVDHGS